MPAGRIGETPEMLMARLASFLAPCLEVTFQANQKIAWNIHSLEQKDLYLKSDMGNLKSRPAYETASVLNGLAS